MEVNTGGQRKAAYNIGLAIWRLKCFYETLVQDSVAVILLNFCAKNPPHRQAVNRYRPFKMTDVQ
ncbi:MAG: hypothetical protein EOO87_20250 [Pedobacter sp.]|nr:MAG: hypothetical protein EOO87_20250 [Pedobacter sp.]